MRTGMFVSDSFSKETVFGSFVREIRHYWRILTRVKRCNCLSNNKGDRFRMGRSPVLLEILLYHFNVSVQLIGEGFGQFQSRFDFFGFNSEKDDAFRAVV